MIQQLTSRSRSGVPNPIEQRGLHLLSGGAFDPPEEKPHVVFVIFHGKGKLYRDRKGNLVTDINEAHEFKSDWSASLIAQGMHAKYLKSLGESYGVVGVTSVKPVEV